MKLKLNWSLLILLFALPMMSQIPGNNNKFKLPPGINPGIQLLPSFDNISRSYADSKMFIFLRQLGDGQVYGLVETRLYAAVIKGTIKKRRDGTQWIDCMYHPIPKGNSKEILAHGNENISLGSIIILNKGAQIKMTVRNGQFGSKTHTLREYTRRGGFIPAARKSGFFGPGYLGFTGLWKCDDGASYYVYQNGSKMIWFGESPGPSKPRIANVMIGTMKQIARQKDEFGYAYGSQRWEINGRWMDLTKGNNKGSGTIKLQGDFLNFKKVSARPDGRQYQFAGRNWTKVRYLELQVLRVKAKTNDACGQMDFFSKLYVIDREKSFGVYQENRDDIRPSTWKLKRKWIPRNNVTVKIKIREDDENLCGGSDDLVDINPQRGASSNPKSYDLHLIVDVTGSIYQKRLDGRRGKYLGKVGFGTSSSTQNIIRMEGDVVTVAPGVASGIGGTTEECAKIEFKINYSFNSN